MEMYLRSQVWISYLTIDFIIKKYFFKKETNFHLNQFTSC